MAVAAGSTIEPPWSTADVYSPDGSKIILGQIKDALSRNGLPHVPRGHQTASPLLSRGRLTGLTSARGATGFSVRADLDALHFNVVITGSEAGVDYEPVEKVRSGKVVTLAKPLNAEILYPKIAEVFEGLSLAVQEVEKAPVQLMWDEDIDYAITTDPLPCDEEREHNLITEMVGLAYESPGDDESTLEQFQTRHALYFALRSVPPDVLAQHLSSSRVSRLIRRSRKCGAPGEHELWLAVRRAQRG